MTRHFFLSSTTVQPPARWREAFPDGKCLERGDLRQVIGAGDIVWLATAQPDWSITLKALRSEASACSVVIMSMVPDYHQAASALDLGARGYCHALSAPGLLREVAVVVSHGGLWVGPDLMARLMRVANRLLPDPNAHLSDAGLSEREREVVREVVHGLSNKAVADKLGITERTVKAHLGSVFEKLGVRDRMQLMLRFSEGNRAGIPD